MDKADKALTVLYAVFGSFTFACFFIYLVKLVFYPEGALSYAAAICACSAVLLPFLLRRPLRRLLKKVYPALKCVLCAGFIFFTATFVFMTAFVCASDRSADPSTFSDDTVFLVFGSKVDPSGEPSSVLRGRLDRAVEALGAAPGSVCIVSGGTGPDEPVSEAEAMRDYLVGAGIEEERVITEDRSADTVQNIDYSIPLIEKTGKGDLVCISTFTHTPRIRLLCEKKGLAPRFFTSGFPEKRFLIPTLVREYLSYVKMTFRK